MDIYIYRERERERAPSHPLPCCFPRTEEVKHVQPSLSKLSKQENLFEIRTSVTNNQHKYNKT